MALVRLSNPAVAEVAAVPMLLPLVQVAQAVSPLEAAVAVLPKTGPTPVLAALAGTVMASQLNSSS
jgi:hypothetical protein